MHDSDFARAYADLSSWCRERDYAGYDPFDGLNSSLFQATPLRYSRGARLLWTQLFKRSAINLRPLARVAREGNPKGIALFALAALADYRRQHTRETELEARALLDDLLAMQLPGWYGAAWGYNFDWQGRAFFAPRGTPTVVPTAFAARAFVEASQTFGDERYQQIACAICDFILQDLNRAVESADEVCFSYSPLDRTRVFNASLLAAETLAAVGNLATDATLSQWAVRATRYVVQRQHEDGSWSYGADEYQSWVDNFHTAFVLTSLSRIITACGAERTEFEKALKLGFKYWRERLFLANGWPKYYPDRLYPADAHSAGAAIVAFLELRWLDAEALEGAEKVAAWTINNLRSPRGFFYYQRRRFCTVRTPYMRWAEAWMAYALARLLEVKRKKERGKTENEGYD